LQRRCRDRRRETLRACDVLDDAQILDEDLNGAEQPIVPRDDGGMRFSNIHEFPDEPVITSKIASR
jgi:hypothetical protein